MKPTPAILLICAFVPAGLAQTTAKPAEEVYKNIVELKGTPADQLQASMQFISASVKNLTQMQNMRP